ncbi:MAG: DUF4209 domain-containing protein [Alistipes sp.]|nr:DUF4209 domain-containing protein [Alistipes sp.]
MDINTILLQFDSSDNIFDYIDISEALGKCSEATKDTIEYNAEIIAMNLIEEFSSNDDIFDGRFYFGPHLIYQDQTKGLPVEFPDREDITPKIVEYWESRIQQTANPYLRARYAGLVWDFKTYVTKQKCSIDIAKQYITDLIANSKNILRHSVIRLKQIKRAIDLSVKLNQVDLLNEAKVVLLDLTNSCDDINAKAIWSAAFSISNDIPKSFSFEEQKQLVADLETRFEIVNALNGEQKNPWVMMDIAEMLAIFYNKHYPDKLGDVFSKVEMAFDEASGYMASMQLEANYHRLHHSLVKYKLKDQAERIRIKISKCGDGIKNELSCITQEMSVSKAEIEQIVNSTLCNDSVEQTLMNIAIGYIPNKEREKDVLDRLVKKAPLTYLMTRVVYDERGRTRNVIKGINDDLESHLIMHIATTMRIGSAFLMLVIDEGIQRGLLSAESIKNYISMSPILREEKRIILNKGIEAYFNGDYLVALHLLVPQIEDAIRELAEINGQCVLQPKKGGDGYQLRLLDDLLRDSRIVELMTPNMANYFRILYTDSRGWNMRNDICHGIAMPKNLDRMAADRVLHSLLCLGLFRMQTM